MSEPTHVHVVPIGRYVGFFLALMVLTAATVAVAYLDLGPFNTIVAMSIAATKALLVALYFMHLRWTSTLTRVFAVAALGWLALLIVLVLADVAARS